MALAKLTRLTVTRAKENQVQNPRTETTLLWSISMEATKMLRRSPSTSQVGRSCKRTKIPREEPDHGKTSVAINPYIPTSTVK